MAGGEEASALGVLGMELSEELGPQTAAVSVGLAVWAQGFGGSWDGALAVELSGKFIRPGALQRAALIHGAASAQMLLCCSSALQHATELPTQQNGQLS